MEIYKLYRQYRGRSKEMFLLNKFMAEPFSAVEPQHEEKAADRPVRKHADPYRHRAEMELPDKEDTECDPAYPHAYAGDSHGVFHIT